jgi:hypothetical protein
VTAHFDWALAVTLSAPASHLAPLAAPGLELDVLGDQGFVAVACVQARRLRPSFLPVGLGLDFFLVGYRIFVHFTDTAGRKHRGLQILGSETNRRAMARGGRWFTHYGYRLAEIQSSREAGRIRVRTSTGLDIDVATGRSGAELPITSPFSSWSAARRYAGPMPNTFAYEAAGPTIIRVEGIRTHWQPRSVELLSLRTPFLEALLPSMPVPAAAFFVEDVDYFWRRGVRQRINP